MHKQQSSLYKLGFCISDLYERVVLTLRLFCLFTMPFEVCEQSHLLMLITR